MPFAQLKSRTGCLKCKARRKKCDEKRPRCTACSRWNFTCLWPAPPEAPARANSPANVTSTDNVQEITRRDQRDGPEHTDSSVLEFPVFQYGPSWDGEERQAFNFFWVQTSNQMAGVFRVQGETEIWSRMLLQGAHQSPEIQHAVCALGALHRHLLRQPQDDQGRMYFLAARQYNKAIQCTMRSTRHRQTSVDAVLVMCILFTLLERLLGDIETAMMHLQIGMKLVADSLLRSADPELSTKAPDERVCIPRATIMTLLRRLERQIYELGHTRLEVDPAQTPSYQIDIPAVFASLDDAISTFELYFSHANHLMHTCEWRQEQQRQAQKPAEADLVSFLHRVLAKWTRAFTSFTQNTYQDWTRSSGVERLMIHTLQLHRLVTYMSLAHYQTGDEMVCDKFVPQFAEAVIHGANIVRAQRQSAEPDTPQGFVSSSGHPAQEPDALNEVEPSLSSSESIPHAPPGTSQEVHMNRPGKPILTCCPFSPLPPLFTIAWRCRDPIIRRCAIRLLQEIDWCDAFWDSKLLVRVGERIMHIEENGYLAGQEYGGPVTPVEQADQIPLSARCRQMRARYDEPHVMVFDFLSDSANDWVPGSDYWQNPAPDSFCIAGRIREKWTISNYQKPMRNT